MARTLAVVGPTATGKTALGLALAPPLDGEIVNADALQAYRGLDIGTAKPTAEERGAVPHHLLDVLEPDEPYSAGEFSRRGRAAIEEIEARGGTAIVVGGSGFYVRALFEGLHEIPPADPEVRAVLRERARAEGLAALRSELAKLDPVTEARLEQGDTQRVLRALEIALSTGRPLSKWTSREPEKPVVIDRRQVGLTLPRAILYDRIEDRVRRMVDAGWVEEVSVLLERFDADSPAFQAIGYRQIAGFLQGRSSLEEAVEDTITATRRFAKRQLTWFRRQRDVEWFSALEMERCINDILTTHR